jgi:predicted lipoprotein with Yx(FWY)xxD motif
MFRAVSKRVVVAAVSVLAAACGGSGSGAGGDNTVGKGPDVAVRSSARLGNYLVSSDGRTLYYFGLDLPGTEGTAPVSNCTDSGGCVSLWPVFHVDSPTVATGLNSADFGEFVRSDGVRQTTYKGWPLYFYAGDAKAGDTNGDNFEVWYVIKDPFYAAVAMTKTGGPALYLADPAGRTLYIDARDSAGSAPTCVGACLNNWPVFAAGNGPLPTGIDPAKLTTVTRPDGHTQSALDGHLLYYFVHDVAPGDTNGRGGLQGAFNVFDPSTL